MKIYIAPPPSLEQLNLFVGVFSVFFVCGEISKTNKGYFLVFVNAVI